MPTKPDMPRRHEVLRDAAARITDEKPGPWLAKAAGVDKTTAYRMLDPDEQFTDIPRTKNVKAVAASLRLPEWDVLALFAREVGIKDTASASTFTAGLDARAHTLTGSKRRAAHMVISLLCDQQEEETRLRALLAEHGIDPDA
ncbi:hypothetical protein [Kineosporia sp. NBRC 101731]|uniref:hypothetical protein n=1 Tax=Kineosporia sp. NBRC 101731 TaxID=3032199 RepID=UPI0024A44E90|nr:hypothetical protein [Kineosporia sp. NBRC 101731]GLY31994.1 hypothetical protein Kisp02_53590 [Kineosporia sp. NBRC 101731]